MIVRSKAAGVASANGEDGERRELMWDQQTDFIGRSNAPCVRSTDQARSHQAISELIQAGQLAGLAIKDDRTEHFAPLIGRRVVGDVGSTNQIVHYKPSANENLSQKKLTRSRYRA